MQLLNKLTHLEKKFAWSFLGFLLALFFGAFTLYEQLFLDKNPKLAYQIETNTEVLNLKEEIDNLKIYLNEIDIQDKNLSLSVLKIKVHNISTVDILENHYDSRDPIGLELKETSKIISVDILRASNEYLQKHATPIFISEHSMTFPPIILEAGHSFTVKLLILHTKESEPTLSSIGKIAGIQEILVEDLSKQDQEKSIFSSAIEGNQLVHLVRVPIYSIAGIFLIIALFILYAIFSVTISDIKSLKLRKHAYNYRSLSKRLLTPIDDYIIEYYIDKGSTTFCNLENKLSDITESCDPTQQTKAGKAPKNNQLDAIRQELKEMEAREMLESDILVIENNKYTVSPSFDQHYKEFLIYLQNIKAVTIKQTNPSYRYRCNT